MIVDQCNDPILAQTGHNAKAPQSGISDREPENPLPAPKRLKNAKTTQNRPSLQQLQQQLHDHFPPQPEIPNPIVDPMIDWATVTDWRLDNEILPSNFLCNIYTHNTPLLDIDINHYSTLCGLGYPRQYIPRALEEEVVQLYIDFTNRANENPMDTTAHKKLFLLNFIIFIDPGKYREMNLRHKLYLIQTGRWDLFTIGAFPGRETVARQEARTKATTITKLLTEGNFRCH
jgi:hypothetical protein